MKTLGINIDGVIRDYLEAFDKQYKKVYVHNPTLVKMDEDFKYVEPSEEEAEKEVKEMQEKIDNLISLPIDTDDLLNHYQFDEAPEFENDNAFKTPDDSEFKKYDMELEMGNKMLTPEEVLRQFMFEKYAFKIFGDSEEFQNAMMYVNRIQAQGLRTKTFKTVLITDLKSNAITANYYFLHKVGSRARNLQVVEDHVDKWNYCDVLIDVSPEAFQNKPEDKISIKVNRPYNQWDETDYSVDSLREIDEILLNKFFKK